MKMKGRIKRLAENFKLRDWRTILDGLLTESGHDFAWLSSYLGAAFNENGPSYYEKLPKRRETYIGIGMAFRQPQEVIDRWIVTFANKKRLYIKDVTEDLIWIYLIQTNLEDPDPDVNYFARYEDCQAMAQAVYRQVWDEIRIGSLSTADMEIEMAGIDHDARFEGLRQFIVDHLDSFKTAYARPRAYLNRFLDSITETAGRCPNLGNLTSLNQLRGYLDDSMINFLSGSAETINTIDTATGKRTLRIKHVPKTKRFHISLGLALGMTQPDLNGYLDLLGYPPLGSDGSRSETLLILALESWEAQHPLPRRFKDLVVHGKESGEMPLPDQCTAVEEMLLLRQELADRFKQQKEPFPYLKQE